MTMQLKGIHHVSAITANAKRNYDFYTNVMGMRLVKKTVNFIFRDTSEWEISISGFQQSTFYQK